VAIDVRGHAASGLYARQSWHTEVPRRAARTGGAPGRAPTRGAGVERRRPSPQRLCEGRRAVTLRAPRCRRIVPRHQPLRHDLELHPGASPLPLLHKHLRTPTGGVLVGAGPNISSDAGNLSCARIELLGDARWLSASDTQTPAIPTFARANALVRSTQSDPFVTHLASEPAPNAVPRQRTETDKRSLRTSTPQQRAGWTTSGKQSRAHSR
jgi:hypothetical protein